MTEYDNYITAVNKIYEYIEIMKQKLNNQDNLNYIEEIENYKQKLVDTSSLVQEKHNKVAEMEELGK